MLRRLAALAVIVLAVGCGGGGGFQVAPVSGTVTMDEKPLPHVYVNFQPVGSRDNPNPGPGSYAVTDDKGRYTLKLVEGGKPGAVVGQHKVSITRQFAEDVRGGPDTGTPDGPTGLPKIGSVKQIPPRYNSPTTLDIAIQPGGTDKADFALTSKP